MSKLEPIAREKGNVRRAAAVRRPAANNQAAQNDDGDVSFGFLLSVWNQWWKWLLPVSLILAAASAAIVMVTFKPKFTATATIEIAENAPWVMSQDQSPRAQKYVATQIEMMRSPRVLNECMSDERIAEMPELKKQRDPVKWLIEKGLEIKQVGNSTLVTATYTGIDPNTAAHLVNTLMDNYFSVQKAQRVLRVNKIVTVLESQKTAQSDQVARLQNLVKTLGKNLDLTQDLTGKNIVVSAATPAQELMKKITDSDYQIYQLEAAITAAQLRISDDGAGVPPELVQAEIDSIPEIDQQRRDLIDAQTRLAQIETIARGGKESIPYRAQAAKVASLKEALESSRAEHYDSVVEKVRAMDQLALTAELKQKRTELEEQKALRDRLTDRYDLERNKLDEEGSKRLEFEFANQQMGRALSFLATISDRQGYMSAERSAPGRPEVYNEATANPEPEQKWPIIPLAATTLASLIIPFGVAFVWESSVKRISSVQQLESRAQVDVIGEVSRLPAQQGGAKPMGHELGLFEESIDSLRTSLLLANDEEELQVLAVCSAVSGEGKTSVSSQLAVSIARATGQPVLLIDGDMRAPDIHEIFQIPLSPGLVDTLDGQVPLEQAINRSWSEHVHLLPAGSLEKSPHKLIGSSAFQAILDEARLWYRYIVIDTPPVLAASESLVIAKQADGTIVCTMRDFSRETHVKLAHHRLQATGANMVGTVLNGVPVRSYASRYGAYGRYGYAEQK